MIVVSKGIRGVLDPFLGEEVEAVCCVGSRMATESVLVV